MKIVLIFPGRVWGGAEQYVLDLGHALRERGHSVDFCYRDAEALKRRLSDEQGARMLPFGGMYDIRWIRAMRDILRERHPDVVHVHTKAMVLPLMIARRLAQSKARVVLTYHDAHRQGPPVWGRRAFRALHRMLFVSDFAFRRWHGSNRWMPTSLCSTIINSVKLDPTPREQSLRQRFGIAEATPLLVFSGRVRRSKGCSTIIEALGLIKDLDWAMVFVGGAKPDAYPDKLKQRADELGIAERVHFTGFTAHSQAWLQEATLGLAPSIMLDPCPLSPLEFMQRGRTVVVSDSGGQPEYVTDGETGLVVKPDDPEGLARAIRSMLTDPARCRAIGEAARRHFEADLSWPRFVDKVLANYGDESTKTPSL